jgi:hypothetical protein
MMYRYAQMAALWIIALSLVADMTLRHAVPPAMLFLHEKAYFKSSSVCEQAISNRYESEALATVEGTHANFPLRQSAMAALLECYERQLLRQRLLANGVSPHYLMAIDLEARMASDSKLPYIAETLVPP